MAGCWPDSGFLQRDRRAPRHFPDICLNVLFARRQASSHSGWWQTPPGISDPFWVILFIWHSVWNLFVRIECLCFDSYSVIGANNGSASILTVSHAGPFRDPDLRHHWLQRLLPGQQEEVNSNAEINLKPAGLNAATAAAAISANTPCPQLRVLWLVVH